MNNLLPNTTTATELQRNYKSVIKKVKRIKRPVVILSNNKPDGILLDFQTYQKQHGIIEHNQPNNKQVFNKYSGSWSVQEARIFDKNIESLFENIEPELWR